MVFKIVALGAQPHIYDPILLALKRELRRNAGNVNPDRLFTALQSYFEAMQGAVDPEVADQVYIKILGTSKEHIDSIEKADHLGRLADITTLGKNFLIINKLEMPRNPSDVLKSLISLHNTLYDPALTWLAYV